MKKSVFAMHDGGCILLIHTYISRAPFIIFRKLRDTAEPGRNKQRFINQDPLFKTF